MEARCGSIYFCLYMSFMMSLDFYLLRKQDFLAQSAETVEYTVCTFADG